IRALKFARRDEIDVPKCELDVKKVIDDLSEETARQEFAEATGLDARYVIYLRQDEVDLLIGKVSGEDANKMLHLRHLWYTFTSTKATSARHLQRGHPDGNVSRYHVHLPEDVAPSETSRNDTVSAADYHFDRQTLTDEATNVRSMGVVSTLPLPAGGKLFSGRSDPRPVSFFLREWLQTCKLYGLSPDNCWRFLLRCLSQSVTSELTDILEEKHLLLEGSIEDRLIAAESFLRSAFDVTNDSIRYRNRLAQVKQRSNEPIGDYIGRLREGIMEGKCIGLSVTQDEILDKFIKGLKPNYQKTVKATYSHVRDVNDLCSKLTLWEGANAGTDSTVNAVVDEDQPAQAAPVPTPATINVSAEVPSSSQAEVNGPRTFRSKRPLRCWHCDGPHLRRNCPVLRSTTAAPPSSTSTTQSDTSQNSVPASAAKPQAEKEVPSANSADSKRFENLGVVGDVLALAGDSACTVDLIIRQANGDIGYAAKLPALLDTGGYGSAYINAGLFREMVAADIIGESLNSCSNVKFGNGECAQVLGCFKVNIENEVKSTLVENVEVKVIEGLSPDFIIGVETIKRSVDLKRILIECLDGTTCRVQDPLLTTFHDKYDEKIDVLHPIDVRNQCAITHSDSGFMVSCPALSGISVMPFTEPRRKRNRTREMAIHRRIGIAARECKFREATVEEATVINEVVWVDKKHGSAKPLTQVDICTMSDEEVKARFRVTLDLRKLNTLVPRSPPDKDDGYVWVMKSDIAQTTKRSTDITQSQDGALNILRLWPPSMRRYFVKVDLSDAFSSVHLDSNLWPLFAFLPQGWRYSPILFSRVVGSILDEARVICRKMGLPIRLVHFQDDILIGGGNERCVLQAKEVVVDLFARYGCMVALNKCEAGDIVDFCGIRCYRSEVFPKVKVPSLTDAAIEESCTSFSKFHDLESRKSWIRSWSGRFQWLSRWLSPDAKVILRRLQRVDPRSSKATSLVKQLARYYLSGLACLYVLGNGNGCHVMGTAIMVDCNEDAWAAIIFQLLVVKKDGVAHFGPHAVGWHQALDALALRMCSELDIQLANDEVCLLLPLSLDGGLVTVEDMARSSTFRERKAQLLALHRFLPLCTSPVVMIGDNANAVGDRYWHTVENDHANDELELRMIAEYHRTVAVTLWVPRLSVVSLVDSMARVLPQDLAVGNITNDDPVHIIDSSLGSLDDVTSDIIATNNECDDDIAIEPFQCPRYCDLDEVREAQQTCPECQALVKGSGFITDDDGVIFRVQRFSPTGRIVKQLLIPVHCRKTLVMQAHADCHANTRQLKFFLSDWCWFPKMGNICRGICRACEVCQVTATKQGRELAPHGTRRPVEGMAAAWQRVGVDVLHVGPGGKLLTCTDWYTAFCDFTPIPDTKAESLVRGKTSGLRVVAGCVAVAAMTLTPR
ncbi:hypothetical protein FOL47_011134, partial [Perkinsus chesapeaki]